MPYKDTELEKAGGIGFKTAKHYCHGDSFGMSDVHRGTEKAGLALEVMLLKTVAI